MSWPAGLRVWARGMYPTEAAVELLVRAFGGRFAEAGRPWVKFTDQDQLDAYIDPEVLLDEGVDLLDKGVDGPYSGSERRVLAVVASLLGGEPVDLSDVMSGLDRANVALVLAALAHANGSHEHSMWRPGGRSTRLPSLYPWPTEKEE